MIVALASKKLRKNLCNGSGIGSRHHWAAHIIRVISINPMITNGIEIIRLRYSTDFIFYLYKVIPLPCVNFYLYALIHYIIHAHLVILFQYCFYDHLYWRYFLKIILLEFIFLFGNQSKRIYVAIYIFYKIQWFKSNCIFIFKSIINFFIIYFYINFFIIIK